MLITFLIVLAHLISAWIIAQCLFHPRRLCDFPISVLLIFMTTFYGLPIIVGGVTGWLNSITVISSAVALMTLAIAVKFTAKQQTNYLVNIYSRLKLLSGLEILVSLIIFLVLASTFLIGTRLPIRTYDAASYHVLGPIRWVLTGRFILDSFGDPFAYPYIAAGQSYANVKGILPFIIMLLSGRTAGTALTQLPYICVLIAGLFSLYRRLGISISLTLVAIVYVLSAPELILQSVSGYADIAYFAALITVIWICLQTWQERVTIQSIISAAMAFTLLIGTKPTALVSCAFLGTVYLTVVWFRTKPPGLLKTRFKLTLIALTVILLMSISVAGWWYISALIHLHNPIYPIKVEFFGKTLFDGPYPKTMNSDFIAKNTNRTGLYAWWGTMIEERRPPVLSSWSSGLGCASFVIGLPCTILAFMTLWTQQKRWHILGIFGLFIALIIISPAMALGRFSLFTLGFTGLAICIVAIYLPKQARIALAACVLALSAYNYYVTIPSLLYRSRPADLVAFDLQSGYIRTAKTDSLPSDYTVCDFWLDKVANTKSLIAVQDDVPVWWFFDAESKSGILRAPIKPEENYTHWIESLKGNKVTHLCLLRNSRFFRNAMNDKRLQLLYWDVIGNGKRASFMELPKEGALFQIRRDESL